MDTLEIICSLRDVKKFLGVFPSDFLPHSIAQSGTVINSDPQTEKVSHLLAVHFRPSSYTSYYFDSYGLAPFIPAIQLFIRHNCSVWNYNLVHLQGPSSTVWGKYCCLKTLYMDRVYTPKQYVGLFITETADKQISMMFQSEFGPLRRVPRGDQWSHSM